MTDPWRELYDREYPRLVRALVAIGRDPAGAEDAAQEAFVKAHRTGLNRIAKPAAWLLVVGSREVFGRRRRARRERELWASLPERHDADGGGPTTVPLRDLADRGGRRRDRSRRGHRVVAERGTGGRRAGPRGGIPDAGVISAGVDAAVISAGGVSVGDTKRGADGGAPGRHLPRSRRPPAGRGAGSQIRRRGHDPGAPDRVTGHGAAGVPPDGGTGGPHELPVEQL